MNGVLSKWAIALPTTVAALLMVACSSTPAPTAAVTTSPSASPTPQSTPVPSTPTSTPAPTPTAVSTTPAFASFSAPHEVACNGKSTIYPHMTWSVQNATGISIAIDTPGGLYDSYGPSGATDQQNDMVPFTCSASPLKHTYYFTTTGGTGPAMTVKVTITGTP